MEDMTGQRGIRTSTSGYVKANGGQEPSMANSNMQRGASQSDGVVQISSSCFTYVRLQLACSSEKKPALLPESRSRRPGPARRETSADESDHVQCRGWQCHNAETACISHGASWYSVSLLFYPSLGSKRRNRNEPWPRPLPTARHLGRKQVRSH